MPWIEAEFPGKCYDCEEPIVKGQGVWYDGQIHCVLCAPEDKSLVIKPAPAKPVVSATSQKTSLKLKSTEQIIKEEVPKTRAKFKKAPAVKLENVVVCGSTKSLSLLHEKAMRATLKKLDAKKLRYVITGTSKGAEMMAVKLCKELKLPVIQVHPLTHLKGTSATHVRNVEVFKFFKPSMVLAFHTDIETSFTTANYLKLGRQKGATCSLIDGKPLKKKKPKKS